MTQAEFTTTGPGGQIGTSNEAQQCNLIMFQLRDELNRMAPWDCVTKWANLTYISSVPTTPENPSSGPPLWQPGMPAPPWAYEYQYPVDCMRARMIIPQYTSLGGGVPIYPPGTATGAGQVGWSGPALKFKVATDQFFGVTAVAPLSTGSGYAVGDTISLQQPNYTFVQSYPPLTNLTSPQTFTLPVGAPVSVVVTSVNASGAVTGVSILNQVYGENVSPSGNPGTPFGGSYFQPQTNPQSQGFTTGVGTGETFNLTYTSALAPQRVVLCNQEQAILCYNSVITDPNIMDVQFQDAWVAILAARLAFQLSGNISLANEQIQISNGLVMQARMTDGNEGITVNDVTPDFLRIRGNWGGPNWEYSPNMSFDWGSFWSPY